MEEVWKPIHNYIGYQVSSDGRVKSCRYGGKHPGKCINSRWRLLKTPKAFGNSRAKIRLLNALGEYKDFYISRLVYSVFRGKIPVGMLVDHIDGNPDNNNVSNLRLANKSQNGANSKLRKNRKYKGVEKCGNGPNCWHVRIIVNKQRLYIGSFSTEKEAAEAYNFKATEYFGEFAFLNNLEGV